MSLMEQAFVDVHRDDYYWMIQFAEKMVGVDLDTCYRRYAEAVGKPQLTDAERRQAILAALLESAR